MRGTSGNEAAGLPQELAWTVVDARRKSEADMATNMPH